jgi:ABC-type transport system involved in multi-copper enzyme maturation permease subunit
MKARMRGPRSYGLIGLYLITMTILLYIVYIQSGGGSSYSYGNPNSFSYGPTRSYEIGQNLFITIFLFLTLVVALVAPAITGVSISREVESRTYELLLVTSVKRRSLIYSKFLSGLFFVLLLVLLSLPFTSMLFIFGGVDLGDLLGGYAIVSISAAAFCAIGLFRQSPKFVQLEESAVLTTAL